MDAPAWKRLQLPKWPLTTTLPLAIAAAILGVTLVITMVAVGTLHARNSVALEEKAAVFLDAMAGHVAQETSIDDVTARAALANALRYPTVLSEEAVALSWTANGALQVLYYPTDTPEPRLSAALEQALADASGASGFEIDQDERGILARSYSHSEEMFAIAALFDAREVVAANRAALISALAINATLAIVAALITFAITRGALSPLRSFADRLAREGAGGPSDSEPAYVSAELADLETALALRQQVEEARSRAAERLAEAERDALLARVAATLAHEVRNPLAGILSALSTFRRFGDDKAVREETLDIVESGLRSLERIADVTLSTYRRRPGHQELTARDILDLDVLIAPEARRRNLTVDWRVPHHLSLLADADAVRQILVNLLLNACKASPPGGTIALEVTVGPEGTRLSVTDMGPGLPAEILSFLKANRPGELPPSRELGIWIVSSLADDMGARLNVESRAGQGTTVTVILPPADVEGRAERVAV